MRKATNTTDTLADVYAAMGKRRPVTITYVKADGSETVRTIETYDVMTTKTGNVIIKAMDRETGESRSWRLDRITFYTVHRMTYTVERETVPAETVPATPEQIIDRELNRDDAPAVRNQSSFVQISER